MKLELDTKALAIVLASVTAQTKNPHANLSVVKDRIFISSQGGGAFLRLAVADSEVQDLVGITEFTFNTGTLASVIKGRTKIVLEYQGEGHEATFSAAGKGRKYTGTMVIPPKEDVNLPKIEESTTLSLTQGIHAALNSALGAVMLSDIYTGNAMHLIAKIDSKGLIAACYDKFHLAIYEDSKIVADKAMNFSLPFSSFSTLHSLTDGQDVKLRITESALIATGANFFILLPLLQADDNKDLATALKFRDTCSNTEPDATFTMVAGDLTTTLSNAYGVYEESCQLNLSAKGNVVTFEMSTTFGKVKESFKLADVKASKDGLKFAFDPNLLNDIMGRLSKDDPIELNLVADKYAYIRRGTGTGVESFYFCSLL